MNTSFTILKPINPPPVLETIWSGKSFVFLALNILTLGIYGTAEIISKKRRVQQLNVAHEELMKQATSLMSDWDQIEKELSSILDSLNSKLDKEDIQSLKGRLAQLSLDEFSPDIQAKTAMTAAKIARETLSFIGTWTINVLSFGLFAVYQNYSLKNRVIILDAKDQFIYSELNERTKDINAQTSKIKGLIEEHLDLREGYDEVIQTDKGKAYRVATDAQKTIADLQKQLSILQSDLTTLRTQKVAAESGKQTVESSLSLANQDLADIRDRHQKLLDSEKRLKQDNDQKNQKIQDVQKQLQALKAQADKVQGLEDQLKKLKDAPQNQSQITKLQTELGPIPPKYKARKEDGDIKGEEGIEDIGERYEDTWSDYAKRYNKLRSAEEVLKAAFDYGFKKLMGMAQEKSAKIHFSDSCAMQKSPGARALYRFMILDLIKGAKLHHPFCDGYELLINNQGVVMVPSSPEKILRYEYDSATKKHNKPVVSINFSRRDDFTPSEAQLAKNSVPYGVDPVSTKWILNQLTSDEQNHLFNLLMSPIIENSNPDFCKTKDFMKNSSNPRAQLIETAYQLISDQAAAIENKFGQNILIPCWQNNVDTTNYEQPFTKDEDIQIDFSKIPDTNVAPVTKQDDKHVEWELDIDVLGDKQSIGNKTVYTQEAFLNLIATSQEKYNAILENLNLMIAYPAHQVSKEIKRLDFEMVNDQYWVSHQMIGADQTGQGGQHCLFSNLLAILVTDKEELTEKNVMCLRNAMAAYLDKLKDAKWRAVHIKDPKTDKEKKDKELASLATIFENAISTNHGCSMDIYQNWLRNKLPTGYVNPKLDLSNLTPLEIQLCAYTVGVKISLLPINIKSNNKPVDYPVKVDEDGRYVPIADYYGPNTKQCLMMGTNNESYYGLFPKINSDKNLLVDTLKMGLETQKNVDEFVLYWLSINMENIE